MRVALGECAGLMHEDNRTKELLSYLHCLPARVNSFWPACLILPAHVFSESSQHVSILCGIFLFTPVIPWTPARLHPTVSITPSAFLSSSLPSDEETQNATPRTSPPPDVLWTSLTIPIARISHLWDRECEVVD